MTRRKMLYVLFCSTLTIMALVLTSCSNGNLFGKLNKPGDSSDVKALMADADNALREKDYSTALTYYERVLAQDPTNSYALYGAAAAAIQSSGISIGQLVSNVVNQSSVAGVSSMGSLIAQSRRNLVTAQAVASNSILYGINLGSLDSVLDTSICRLSKIVSNSADGAIKANDVDVMLNLGILFFIRAVIRPVRKDLLDIRNTNGTYSVVTEVTFDDNVCTGATLLPGFTNASEQQDFLVRIARDVVSAYALFNKVVDILHLTGSPIIVKLTDDMNDAATEILTGSSGVPGQCVALFNAVPITIGNTDVLNIPPTGC